MKLKLFKTGNSFAVRLPMDVVRPFIGAGEIEIEFPKKKSDVLETRLDNSRDIIILKEKGDADPIKKKTAC